VRSSGLSLKYQTSVDIDSILTDLLGSRISYHQFYYFLDNDILAVLAYWRLLVQNLDSPKTHTLSLQPQPLAASQRSSGDAKSAS